MEAKICGVKDQTTLNFIVSHPSPPNFIGFIVNYKKSIRYVEFEKLKKLLRTDKKKSKYVAVLVKPSKNFLEKIKDLNFDYFQIYDLNSEEISYIKSKYKKMSFIISMRGGSHEIYSNEAKLNERCFFREVLLRAIWIR